MSRYVEIGIPDRSWAALIRIGIDESMYRGAWYPRGYQCVNGTEPWILFPREVARPARGERVYGVLNGQRNSIFLSSCCDGHAVNTVATVAHKLGQMAMGLTRGRIRWTDTSRRADEAMCMLALFASLEDWPCDRTSAAELRQREHLMAAARNACMSVGEDAVASFAARFCRDWLLPGADRTLRATYQRCRAWTA